MATNVHLTPELERFARECVECGRYNNVSEVVRASLRLLQDAGIVDRDPLKMLANPAIDQAVRNLAKLAHAHYDEAQGILRKRPKGQLRAPRLMGAVYAKVLAKMEAQGWAPPRTRVRVGKGELLLILLRHGLM